ncbi:MAG TPA: hypothetical protein VD902_20790, partial [Symbiobacteriaceae bacterium]|nr:hypothetical protein [Symbiobacteriaceae bacterium]
MTLVMVGVTIWSGMDGGQSPWMIAAACIGVVAAMNVLALLAALLPQTRIITALFSALWILVFMPAWDWLANRFIYPESLWSALLFSSGFGLVRLFLMPGKSARP